MRFRSRSVQSIMESVIISLGSTAITLVIAVLAAYAVSRMMFKGRNSYLNWVLGQRFMPPIAILVPLVTIYKTVGMRDTDNLYAGYFGLMMIYALMNLPIAVLLMKSFLDDVPKDVDEAAMIDGATRWQKFKFITWPSMRSLYLTSTILSMIWTLGDFNSVYLLTGGGPADLTHVLATLGIRYLRLDQIDLAMASIVVALPLVLPLVYFMMKRLSK